MYFELYFYLDFLNNGLVSAPLLFNWEEETRLGLIVLYYKRYYSLEEH